MPIFDLSKAKEGEWKTTWDFRSFPLYEGRIQALANTVFVIAFVTLSRSKNTKEFFAQFSSGVSLHLQKIAILAELDHLPQMTSSSSTILTSHNTVDTSNVGHIRDERAEAMAKEREAVHAIARACEPSPSKKKRLLY